VDERAVRIVLGVGEGMVLAMDGHPLATILAPGEPEDDAEEEVGERMEGECAMREKTDEALLKPRMPTASGPRKRAMMMVDRRPKPFPVQVPVKRTMDFRPRSPRALMTGPVSF